MSNLKPLDATEEFDDRIRDRIERIRQTDRCEWCKDARHPIQNKTMKLCSYCNRWRKIQQRLEAEVGQLPPKRTRDPHWEKRLELDVAKEAIKLCKVDGNVRDYRLNQVKPIDLEHTFDGLSRRILGRRRGPESFPRENRGFFPILASPTHLDMAFSLRHSKRNEQERAWAEGVPPGYAKKVAGS